jgi:hypothetical protein
MRIALANSDDPRIVPDVDSNLNCLLEDKYSPYSVITAIAVLFL